MKANDPVPLMHFAADFATACEELKNATLEKRDATLNHEQASAMITALRVGFKKP